MSDYNDDDVQAAGKALARHSLIGEARFTDYARAVLDAVAPAIAARAKAEALREAITAHRNLHMIYGSTATCGGGIGGQMMTQHCGVTCNRGNHDAENAAWEEVERTYFEIERGASR